MKWFVVSMISVIDTQGKLENDFPVSEEFYLFSASNEDELQKKINEKKLLINAVGAEGVRYKGFDAKEYCLGVRKIRSIYNEPPLDIDSDPPSDGTELTHSFMNVKSLADAKLLASGKSVLVNYIDDDNDE